jgi:MFS family permease
VLASASGVAGVGTGVLLWGLHMGFTRGLFTDLIADTAHPNRRGTAFGLFNLVSGLAQLCASVIAGAFWDALGPQETFSAGAAFAVVALLAFFPLGNGFAGQWR